MLEDVQKSLEQQLVRLFVASASYSTSQNRKVMTKQTLQEAKQSLKQANNLYVNNLSNAAKGKWVDAAKNATEKINKQFDWLT